MAAPGWTESPLFAKARAVQLECWQRGEPISVEALLERHPLPAADSDVLLDLIYSEVLLKEEAGEPVRIDDYVLRFPSLAEALRRQFAVHAMLDGLDDTDDPSQVTHPSADGNGAPAAAATAAPNRIGDYLLLEEVGRGGMGVVYRARHQSLSTRFAAIKLLRQDRATSDALARFQTEANAVAKLNHPHIVPIYDFGSDAGPNGSVTHFVAFEWAEGGTLAQRLAGAPIASRRAAELLLPLAEAVDYAHRQGILHRDLKPSNILLTPKEEPKIADFGLAKNLDGDEGQTRTGAVLGTPSYMAPEQASGDAGKVGLAVDVYALGAILYEMLTGRPPFRADTVLNTVQQVRTLEPIAPRNLQPNVARDLETICLKCLRKEPAKRYASALELAEDLRRFLNQEPIRARRAGLAERGIRWTRRRPALASLLVGSVFAAAALAGIWVHFTFELCRERDEARRQSDRALQILKHARVTVDTVAMTVRSAKAEELRTGNAGSVLVQLACSYGKTSATLAQDEAFAPSDRKALSDQYAQSAVKLLECAKTIGYFDSSKPENREQAKGSPELAVLRGRPDFDAFLASIR